MKAVLNLSGKLFSLAEAAKAQAKSPVAWRCAACKARVHVRNAFGRPVLTHPTNGCTGELESFDNLATARRATALLAQNWSLSVSRGSELGQLTEVAHIPLERVMPFLLPDVDVPMVLVQSYWSAFLVGVVATHEQVSALAKAANRLACGALAVPAEQTAWQGLSATLFAAEVSNAWVAPVEQARVDNKRGMFNRIAGHNSAASSASETRQLIQENRQAVHYEPQAPTTARQYLQDITGELRAQRWAKWVRRLVLGRDWGRPRAEWFDAYPVQVPHFWLRFWLVKHSLYQQGRLIDPSALATELLTNWDAQADPELVASMVAVFKELLDALQAKSLVERRGSNYYCARSFR